MPAKREDREAIYQEKAWQDEGRQLLERFLL